MSDLDNTPADSAPERIEIGNTQEDTRGRVLRSPWWYWGPLLTLGAFYLLLGAYFVLSDSNQKGLLTILGYVTWTLGAAHYLTGITSVGIESLVSVSFLGIPSIQISGGPLLLPYGLFKLHIGSLQTFQYEFPNEPSKIYRGEADTVPKGFTPPARVTFADPRDSYQISRLPLQPLVLTNEGVRKGDPTHRRTTQEVSTFVRWRILDEPDFRRNIGSLSEARRQMEDSSEGFLTEVLTQIPLAVALLNTASLNRELERRMRDTTRHWGIELLDCRIKAFGLSRAFNVAIQGIGEADAKAQAGVLTSDGKRQELINEGTGTAEAKRLSLVAEGEGMHAIAKKLTVPGASIFAAEAAAKIIKAANGTVIAGTSAGLTDILAAGTVLLNDNNRKGGTSTDDGDAKK